MYHHDLPVVAPDTPEASIIAEELSLLAKVQKQLARDQLVLNRHEWGGRATHRVGNSFLWSRTRTSHACEP